MDRKSKRGKTLKSNFDHLELSKNETIEELDNSVITSALRMATGGNEERNQSMSSGSYNNNS